MQTTENNMYTFEQKDIQKKTNGVISSLLSFILPWLPEKMAIGHEAIRDSLANFFYSG